MKIKLYKYMKLKFAKSDFYDYSQRPKISWKIQGLIFPSIYYGYDKEQKCYFRKIKNVIGLKNDTFFIPILNLFVNYKQILDVNKYNISK